jgi:tetratricopeptide (TPR) repeat protein
VEGEATALHNLAEIHRTLGSPQQALSQYQNALNLYWARQDQRRQGLTRYGMAHALRQLGDLASAAIHYHRALEHFEAAGDRLMMSRAHHALAGLHRQEEKIPAAQEHLQQALAITRSIGYGLGIAYGLVALSDLQAQQGELAAARTHLHEAITWLQLIEDVPGLEDARTRLQALERDEVPKVKNLKLPGGWVKSHITLAEGKVYCAFESPMAQEILADLKVIEVTSTEPPPLS